MPKFKIRTKQRIIRSRDGPDTLSGGSSGRISSGRISGIRLKIGRMKIGRMKIGRIAGYHSA